MAFARHIRGSTLLSPMRAGLLPAVGLISVLALPGCSHAPDTTAGFPATPIEASSDLRAIDATTGLASYYAVKFEGKRTASGETYHRDALTAAHLTLPFGTRVRVTRLATGKSVEVVINDRGPQRKGRIIDLSRRAAEILDLVRAGVARVRVEVLERPAG